MPNATALALADHAEVAGSASALLGVNQFLVGAIVAPIVGIAGVSTAVPMALVMLLLCLGAALALVTLTRPTGMARMNLEDVTAILREYVDPGLEAVEAHPRHGRQQPGDVVRRREGGERRSRRARPATHAPAGVLAWTDGARNTPCSARSRVTASRSRQCSHSASTSARSSSWNGFPATRPGDSRRLSGGRSGWRSAPCSPGSMRSTRASLGLAGRGSHPRRGRLLEVRRYQRLYESARPAPVPLLGALLAWAERNCPQDEVRPAVLWGDPGAHNLLVADGHVTRCSTGS